MPLTKVDSQLVSGAITTDSSGNVGIGTASPSSFSPSTTYANTVAVTKTDQALSFGSYYQAGVEAYSFIKSSQVGSPTTAIDLKFYGGNAEFMRIDSSAFAYFDCTSTSATNGGTVILGPRGTGSPRIHIGHGSGVSSGNPFMYFYYAGGTIGSITQNGTTAVLYNTTSDYRLKSNVQDLSSGLQTIQALRPVSFEWSDGRKDDGFLAHEYQEIIPNGVVGEKDATDEEGNPKYQQMDNSSAIPFLVKAIQELKAELDATKAEVAALKEAA